MNLGGHIIATTEDKVRLAVMTHLSQIARKHEWVAPCGLLVPIAATFATATFKQAWLPAATWQAVFLLVGLGALVWLIVSVIRGMRAPSIDDFVDALKSVSRS